MFKILHISWFTKTSYENKTYRWKWRKGRVFHSKIFFSYDMGILESLNTHIIHTLIFWGVFRGHLHVCLALPQIYPRKWKEEISKCSTSTNNCSNGTYDPSLSMFSDTGKSFSIMIYPFLLAPLLANPLSVGRSISPLFRNKTSNALIHLYKPFSRMALKS